MAAPAGDEPDVDLAAERPVDDRRLDDQRPLRRRGTPRTARGRSSPPGRARRAAARSCEPQLPLVVAGQAGRPLDPPDRRSRGRAGQRANATSLPAAIEPRTLAPCMRLEERPPVDARALEAVLAEARVRGGARRDPDVVGRASPITRPPGRRTSRTASGTRASSCRSARCGASRRAARRCRPTRCPPGCSTRRGRRT